MKSPASDEGLKRESILSSISRNFGLARFIIVLFLIYLLIQAYFLKLPMPSLFSNMLTRLAMNVVLTLAMIPTIQGGMGPNFALPLGIVCGLVGMAVSMEYSMAPLTAFVAALVIAVILAIASGWLYGAFLNGVSGQEMTVGTYFGFSIVSLMCIFWTVAPFSNPELIWAIGGKGLRNTISLKGSLGGILDSLWSFEIFSVEVPAGTLLFVAVCCALVRALMRSRVGVSITAVGNNPRFAMASGLNVKKHRILAMVFSNVLAAVGIVIYSQSFGFLQLYLAPLFMGFISVASILIGGASMRNAGITHALVGTFLFQSILVVSMPVANVVFTDNMSDICRIIVSNGIILYALTRKSEGAR
ncbi:MAG: ABC transporter permease [Synergistaceae bacterium]|jgi:simple sugar transport system permease protein|nr:ABC transporter permease [Synergistaceae bacterium]